MPNIILISDWVKSRSFTKHKHIMPVNAQGRGKMMSQVFQNESPKSLLLFWKNLGGYNLSFTVPTLSGWISKKRDKTFFHSFWNPHRNSPLCLFDSLIWFSLWHNRWHLSAGFMGLLICTGMQSVRLLFGPRAKDKSKRLSSVPWWEPFYQVQPVCCSAKRPPFISICLGSVAHFSCKSWSFAPLCTVVFQVKMQDNSFFFSSSLNNTAKVFI